MVKNPLLDKDFLYQLDQYRHKEIYAKIISLSFDEQPLEQIEGRVTSGSINIDGSSAVQRTCNLSFVAKDVNITDFYWGVSNKFTLEIGVKNFINPLYPDIIWFKQGIYVITSFNSSLTQNNYSISISGKDKMCLLNGDIGGNLPASIDFGKIDSYTNTFSRVEITDYTQYVANKYYIYSAGEYVISKEEYKNGIQYYTKDILLEQEDLTLKDIIRESVHTYGKEPYHNIIINDLDDYGLELLEYRGDTPLYLLYDEDGTIYDQYLTEDQAKETKVTPIGQKEPKPLTECYLNTAIDELNSKRDMFYLQVAVDENNNPVYKKYSVSKIEYGHTAGYRTTDLIYAGDLISSIGESLTSILDKIKNMLGGFEYFYDVDGKFIFQRKKLYNQQSWNTLQKSDDNVFARDAVEESPYSYSFEDVNLIQKFTNTPVINNIKNDYSVWGIRKSIDGAEIPIHGRYAIHEKPVYYKSFDGKIYCTDSEIIEEIKASEQKAAETEVLKHILNFELQHPVPIELKSPVRDKNTGDWSAGWWDIRDWYEYYKLLTEEIPNGTMKWYSRNDEKLLDKDGNIIFQEVDGEKVPVYSGCVKATSLPIRNWTEMEYNNGTTEDYVWLIIKNKNGDYNPQHGSGNPYKGHWYYGLTRKCQYYTSVIDENGNLQTDYVKPEIYKDFIYPFAECTDSHTFLEFLEKDIKEQGHSVYFYNPMFPSFSNAQDSFKEIIQNRVNEKFEKLMKSVFFVDWRELIYQMAKDYYKHHQEADFNQKIIHNNIRQVQSDRDGEFYEYSYYHTGETGYEMFYTDIQGFWRQLYDPDPDKVLASTGGYYSEEKEYLEKETIEITSEEEFINAQTVAKKANKKIYVLEEDVYKEAEEYVSGTQYYTDSATYKIVTVWNPFNEDENNFTCNYYLKGEPEANKIPQEQNYSLTNYYWNKNVIWAPELLNFWLDFYDGGIDLSQYSISAIGDRPKVVNNNKVTSIYFRNVPQVIFTDVNKYDPLNAKTGYTYIYLANGMENLFTISAQSKSAEEEVNELFNKHSYCSESVSITTIPIYHLVPNTLVYIHNEENHINGKYQVSKITIPLTYNGTMSITASKVIEQI